MVFKQSFKCLKSKKINFIQAFLKLETQIYQSIHILFHLILYSQSDIDSKKKESGLREKKTCHIALVVEKTFHVSSSIKSSFTYDMSCHLLFSSYRRVCPRRLHAENQFLEHPCALVHELVFLLIFFYFVIKDIFLLFFFFFLL
jgi:hypothetical protein